MNKHLLETRLRSIAHYNSEIVRQNEALKITESTLSDVVESCKEFFPFENGDLLQKGSSIYQVRINGDRILSIGKDGNSIAFSVWLLEPCYRDSRQEWREVSSYPNRILFSDLDKYKVIGNTEKK